MNSVSEPSLIWAPVTHTLTSLMPGDGLRSVPRIAWSQRFFSSLSRLERVSDESSLQAAAPSFCWSAASKRSTEARASRSPAAVPQPPSATAAATTATSMAPRDTRRSVRGGPDGQWSVVAAEPLLLGGLVGDLEEVGDGERGEGRGERARDARGVDQPEVHAARQPQPQAVGTYEQLADGLAQPLAAGALLDLAGGARGLVFGEGRPQEARDLVLGDHARELVAGHAHEHDVARLDLLGQAPGAPGGGQCRPEGAVEDAGEQRVGAERRPLARRGITRQRTVVRALLRLCGHQSLIFRVSRGSTKGSRSSGRRPPSIACWRSSSAFTSAPNSTAMFEIQSQTRNVITPPRAP